MGHVQKHNGPSHCWAVFCVHIVTALQGVEKQIVTRQTNCLALTEKEGFITDSKIGCHWLSPDHRIHTQSATGSLLTAAHTHTHTHSLTLALS